MPRPPPKPSSSSPEGGGIGSGDTGAAATTVDFDALLPYIGEMGKYQMTFYLLMCIPTMPAAFLAFNQVFLSAEPEHWCRVSDFDRYPGLNQSQQRALSIPRRYLGPGFEDIVLYHRCRQYDVNFTEVYLSNGGRWPDEPDREWNLTTCREGWIYDKSEFQNTLVTELDLVCDRNWWPSTSTALFYVGSLFGNVLFGYISDKYGRRTSFFSLLFMEVTISIITSFSPNYVVFTVLRTINGFTFPALFQIPFIVTLEIMGPAYRTFAGMMICLFFAVALMILAGLAYVFNSWFDLALVTSVPFVLLFSYWWIIPESPRWLLSYGRLDEAEVIIQNIARWNNKQIPPNFVRQFAEMQKQKEQQGREQDEGDGGGRVNDDDFRQMLQPQRGGDAGGGDGGPPKSVEFSSQVDSNAVAAANASSVVTPPPALRRDEVLGDEADSNDVSQPPPSLTASPLPPPSTAPSSPIAQALAAAATIATASKPPQRTPSMFLLLLYYPVARRNFFLITFNWLANALVYNGLSFYSANLNVNSFLGFFISSAVEIPSYFVGWYAMDKWGRRWVLFATMTTGGIAGICCIFVPLDASPWITVTLAMIGKFQIAASFAVIYVYAGELMPTVVRSESMGVSSFVAGIGLLIFPYINALGSYSHVLPLVIMGTLSVMGGVTALFLPETLWTHLPNTLEEGEEFGSDFKICSCPHRSPGYGSKDAVDEGEVVAMNDMRRSTPSPPPAPSAEAAPQTAPTPPPPSGQQEEPPQLQLEIPAAELSSRQRKRQQANGRVIGTMSKKATAV